MSAKKALITGITGQDGSYLCDLLLSKGYEVHGIALDEAADPDPDRATRIQHIVSQLHLHVVSIEDAGAVAAIFREVQPDECYHLAAQSAVTYSFDSDSAALNMNIRSTHSLLGGLRTQAPHCRFFFAASSEVFGRAEETPQRETTPFHPRSAYGVSKVAGFHLTRMYRETHNLHASSGILYNHESPRRGRGFVSRKITLAIADILAGRSRELCLGNIDSHRDWGHAREYVEAMWLMLQQEHPDDYVIATGKSHSVREFINLAFAACGLDSDRYVIIDPALFRPADASVLVGNPEKAYTRLGWRARIELPQLVREMVDSDCTQRGVDAVNLQPIPD